MYADGRRLPVEDDDTFGGMILLCIIIIMRARYEEENALRFLNKIFSNFFPISTKENASWFFENTRMMLLELLLLLFLTLYTAVVIFFFIRNERELSRELAMCATKVEKWRLEDAVVSLVKKLEAQVQAISNRLADLEASREEEKTPTPLWKLFTEEGECRDVLENHVLTKLNDTDLKLFHFVSKESRAAIRRAEIEMVDKCFRLKDFSSPSTLEMAFHRFKTEDSGCPLVYYTSDVAKTNKLELLRFVREVLQAPWQFQTPGEAAKLGNIEMMKYCIRNGCQYRVPAVCVLAAEGGHLDCLRFAHEEALVPMNNNVLKAALNFNNMDCYQYAKSKGCPESSSDESETEDDDDDEEEEEEEED